MDEVMQTRCQEAAKRVREQYEHATGWARVSLESVNRVRPPSRQYRGTDEIVRERLAAAGAVSRFAVSLGLITPEQTRDIILEFQRTHPDVFEEQ